MLVRLAAVLIVLLLAACTGVERDSATEASPSEAPQSTPDAHEPEGGHGTAKKCPVTVGTVRAWGSGTWEELTYRNGPLWVALYPKGIVHATAEDVQEDGPIAIKFGWWRETKGRLAIDGRRLDETESLLRARVPTGYGKRGFQSTALIFSGPGCWEVTGSLGVAKLTFVTRVVGP